MTDGKHEPECNAWCDGDTHYLLAESDEACPECGTPCRVEPHKLHRHYTPLDAARERPSALDVERLLHAAYIALGVQEVARQAGNADLFAALEPLRHAVRAARLTEPDAGEGTEREGHVPRLTVDGVCCDEHAATLCGCGNFGDHVPNVDCASTPDTTEATLRAALDAIPTVALSYPKGPKYIEHDEDCAFAYGNTTYNCHCFVRLSAVRDALQQPAVQSERQRLVNEHNTLGTKGHDAGPWNECRKCAAVQPEGGPE